MVETFYTHEVSGETEVLLEKAIAKMNRELNKYEKIRGKQKQLTIHDSDFAISLMAVVYLGLPLKQIEKAVEKGNH